MHIATFHRNIFHISVFIESIDVTLFAELERVSDLVVIHKVIYFQDHRIGSSVSAMSEKINKSLSCTSQVTLETFLWNGDLVELKLISSWDHSACRICNSFGVNTYRWPSSRTAAQEMNDSLKVPSYALLFFFNWWAFYANWHDERFDINASLWAVAKMIPMSLFKRRQLSTHWNDQKKYQYH